MNAASQPPASRTQSPRTGGLSTFVTLVRHRPALLLLMFLLLAAVMVLMLPGSHSAAQDRDAILEPASVHHLAGTDALGRDRLVRSAAAMLLALTGASLAAAVTTAVATIVGILAAFSPAPVGALLLLLSDVFLTLPWLFLLMIVRAGTSLTESPMHAAVIAFMVLAALGWPACARAVYRGGRRLNRSEWMLQGRAAGLRPVQMLRLHVLPHLQPLILPQFLVSVPAFIIAESNLGSLGLGVPEPLPSWGGLLAELNNSALLAHTRWVYLPIVLLVVVLLLLESLMSTRWLHPGSKNLSETL